MKIGIYSEFFSGNVLGGREFNAAVLIKEFGEKHEVTFLHHDPALTAADFADYFGIAPELVQLRCFELEQMPSAKSLWKRHHEEKLWHASLSAPYDLFVDIAHFLPPFCHARVGVLLILFPAYRPAAMWDFVSPPTSARRGHGWRRARRLFHRWQWRRRIRSYDLKISISQFTQKWTEKLWEVDSKIIYPPAFAAPPPQEKRALILSVGRFSVAGVLKRQDKMMKAYRELLENAPGELRAWRYVTVGGIGPSKAEQEFLDKIELIAQSIPALAQPNVSRSALSDLYAHASIFWHAAGYEQEEDPGHAEHYGIATVEAMLAGCVPVVIRKGAQPEIVEHGISGFLWDTLEELQSYTRDLIRDEALRQRMSLAARQRAERCFTRERFIEDFVASVQPYLSSPLLGRANDSM